jgi:hypothetical protein
MQHRSYLSRIAREGINSRLTLAVSRILFRPPPPAPERLRGEAASMEVFPAEVLPTTVTDDKPGAPKHLTSPLPLAPAGRAEAPLAEGFAGEATPAVPIVIDKPTPTHDTMDRPEKTVSQRPPRVPLAPSSPLADPGQARLAAISGRVAPEPEKRPSRQATKPPPVPSLAHLQPTEPAAPGSTNVELRPEPACLQGQSLSPTPSPQAPTPPVSTNETAAVMRPWPTSLRARSNATHNAVGYIDSPAEPSSQHALGASRRVLAPSPPVWREPSARNPGSTERRDGIRKDARAAVRIGSLEVRIVPPLATTTRSLRPSPASRPSPVLSRGFRSFGLNQG